MLLANADRLVTNLISVDFRCLCQSCFLYLWIFPKEISYFLCYNVTTKLYSLSSKRKINLSNHHSCYSMHDLVFLYVYLLYYSQVWIDWYSTWKTIYYYFCNLDNITMSQGIILYFLQENDPVIQFSQNLLTLILAGGCHFGEIMINDL